MRAIPMLLLAAILPFSLRAQSSTPTVTKDATSSAASLQAQAADDSNGAPVSSTISGGDIASSSTPAQQSKSPSQQKPKPANPKPSSDLGGPPSEGSMVGYIDNAIVGSEIRLRFDAAFDNNRPDRAEFFYAQCGCDGPPARGPAPGLVLHLNFQQLYMRAEYAPVHRFSVFAEVPFRWVQPQVFIPQTIPPSGGFGNQAGISDVTAGFKFAPLATHEHYLTFQFSATFPSGDSSKGLGTNHYTVQPALLFFQRVSDRMSFEAQLEDSHPIGGSSLPGFTGDVFSY